MNLEAEILKGLQAQYQFRKTKGAWLQEGTCPACNKREAFCAAKDPKIVRCGRQDRCGWEITVRDALPDLFEDWSKRFPETEENPTATADAGGKPVGTFVKKKFLWPDDAPASGGSSSN